MKITVNDFSGRYEVEGIEGKTFPTRKMAENAYTKLMAKQEREVKKKELLNNPSVNVSFMLGFKERNRLLEIAEQKGVTLSKLIRQIVEKEVSDYERKPSNLETD